MLAVGGVVDALGDVALGMGVAMVLIRAVRIRVRGGKNSNRKGRNPRKLDP